jgi:hypothetical protein
MQSLNLSTKIDFKYIAADKIEITKPKILSEQSRDTVYSTSEFVYNGVKGTKIVNDKNVNFNAYTAPDYVENASDEVTDKRKVSITTFPRNSYLPNDVTITGFQVYAASSSTNNNISTTFGYSSSTGSSYDFSLAKLANNKFTYDYDPVLKTTSIKWLPIINLANEIQITDITKYYNSRIDISFGVKIAYTNTEKEILLDTTSKKSSSGSDLKTELAASAVKIPYMYFTSARSSDLNGLITFSYGDNPTPKTRENIKTSDAEYFNVTRRIGAETAIGNTSNDGILPSIILKNPVYGPNFSASNSEKYDITGLYKIKSTIVQIIDPGDTTTKKITDFTNFLVKKETYTTVKNEYLYRCDFSLYEKEITTVPVGYYRFYVRLDLVNKKDNTILYKT